MLLGIALVEEVELTVVKAPTFVCIVLVENLVSAPAGHIEAGEPVGGAEAEVHLTLWLTVVNWLIRAWIVAWVVARVVAAASMVATAIRPWASSLCVYLCKTLELFEIQGLVVLVELRETSSKRH